MAREPARLASSAGGLPLGDGRGLVAAALQYAAGEFHAGAADQLSRTDLADRWQYRLSLGLRPRLELRLRLLPRRTLLDCRRAFCRHRAILVAGALCRRRRAGWSCDLHRFGAPRQPCAL